MLRTAMHTGWKRNTTDSWASKYNNFRETKMNPGNCCTLRIENTGELGACSMPTDPQLQNKDTNQSVQKKEKRKQHIPALQREWIPVVCLIAIDTAAAGLDVPLARQQFFRNFLRDFDHHIFHIPRVKIPQIDFLHCVSPFR